jgi:hypothetical protein
MLLFNQSQTVTLSLKLSTFSFAFWAPSTFEEADFHKMKGRKIFSRSRTNINTAEDNMGLTVSPPQLSCGLHLQEFKIFVLEFSFDLLFIFFLTAFGQNHT